MLVVRVEELTDYPGTEEDDAVEGEKLVELSLNSVVGLTTSCTMKLRGAIGA